MSDLIDRQAAIDALIEWYECEENSYGYFRKVFD